MPTSSRWTLHPTYQQYVAQQSVKLDLEDLGEVAEPHDLEPEEADARFAISVTWATSKIEDEQTVYLSPDELRDLIDHANTMLAHVQ